MKRIKLFEEYLNESKILNKYDKIGIEIKVTDLNEDFTRIGIFKDGEKIGNCTFEYMFIDSSYFYFEGEMTENEYYEIFNDKDFIKLERIFISKNHKRKGYGKLLLKESIKYIFEKYKNINSIYLNASPEYNTIPLLDLIHFYEEFGFKTIKEYKNNNEMILNRDMYNIKKKFNDQL